MKTFKLCIQQQQQKTPDKPIGKKRKTFHYIIKTIWPKYYKYLTKKQTNLLYLNTHISDSLQNIKEIVNLIKEQTNKKW